jgi:hypothetical protein
MNLTFYAMMQLNLFLGERKEAKRKYSKNYSEEDYLFYDNSGSKGVLVLLKSKVLLKETI